MITIETFVHILDVGGTFVFAISERLRRSIDASTFSASSSCPSCGKFWWYTPDLVIGAVPPAALTDGRYLLVSIFAGLITFFWYAGVDRLRSPVLLFDAVGLHSSPSPVRKRQSRSGQPGNGRSPGHVDGHRRRHDA